MSPRRDSLYNQLSRTRPHGHPYGKESGRWVCWYTEEYQHSFSKEERTVATYRS